MGLPHTVDDSARCCALIRDFALFYVLYWSLVSNKKKTETRRGGGGNQGVRNKDALLNVDYYVDLPAPKKMVTHVRCNHIFARENEPFSDRKQLSRNARVGSGW